MPPAIATATFTPETQIVPLTTKERNEPKRPTTVKPLSRVPIHNKPITIPDDACVWEIPNGGLLCRFHGDNGLGTLREVTGSPEDMFGPGAIVDYFRLALCPGALNSARLIPVTPIPNELPLFQLALC